MVTRKIVLCLISVNILHISVENLFSFHQCFK